MKKDTNLRLHENAAKQPRRLRAQKSTFAVIFIIQKGKVREDGTPIVARITVNGEMVHFEWTFGKCSRKKTDGAVPVTLLVTSEVAVYTEEPEQATLTVEAERSETIPPLSQPLRLHLPRKQRTCERKPHRSSPKCISLLTAMPYRRTSNRSCRRFSTC